MEADPVLNALTLGGAFNLYWEDMKKCEEAKAYWCVLHVTVCLPDICAALQADNGRSRDKLYAAWCDHNLKGPLLTGRERWGMRCQVLHQGRSSAKGSVRYDKFAFGQPSSTGLVDHGRVEGSLLHLDVGRLASEMRDGVESWIAGLAANAGGMEAQNVEKNLPKLVRVSVSVTISALTAIATVGPSGTVSSSPSGPGSVAETRIYKTS